jgi:hypothetical protein
MGPYRPISTSRATCSRNVSSPRRPTNSARGLHNASDTASDTPFFGAPWLLVPYRSASTAGASPVHAERMLRRLVPGSLTGLNVIPEVESVTALRIHLMMISCELVSRIREFGSIVK